MAPGLPFDAFTQEMRGLRVARRVVGHDDAFESGAHSSDESGAHRARSRTNLGRLITGWAHKVTEGVTVRGGEHYW